MAKKKMMTSNSAGHRAGTPTTISNMKGKHCGLPTDLIIMDYPMREYLADQYVGDSIVDADRTQNMGVRKLREQSMEEKY
jgi:hypothetical protein